MKFSKEAQDFLEELDKTVPDWSKLPYSHPTIKKLNRLFTANESERVRSIYKVKQTKNGAITIHDSATDAAAAVGSNVSQIYYACKLGNIHKESFFEKVLDDSRKEVKND